MIWSGEYFKCRDCGEIYPYRTPQCPCCGGVCDRIGSFVREDFSDWSPQDSGAGGGDVGGPLKSLGRVARWAQKLLDLSLGNRLLNLKDSKKIIPLLCPNIAALEDSIAANETVVIQSLSGLLGEQKYQDYLRGQLSYSPADFNTSLEKELGKHHLWTKLSPPETQKRLKELYRLAKLDLEESGVNTLFLALGFLEWNLGENDERTYRSPILLVPIRFERRSITDGIRMMRLDDDTVLNATLVELLRCQFGITVNGLDPLPIDASGVDVPQIMDRFRDVAAQKKGWTVSEEAMVGHFSFGKFVMWKDMTSRIEAFKENKLVAHLISGGGMYDDGVEVFPPEEVAKHIDPAQLYCPMSADSSQLTAVLYSAIGKTFVLHGPPGTGKSQTITNIIAHNLAIGRKVLFVSEKKAALDVVHKRLSSIGLSPFCLELHSNKAGKAEVLAQFAAALKVADRAEPANWGATVDSINRLKGDLNGYVDALHFVYPNGKSAYDCFCVLMHRGASRFDGCIDIDCKAQTLEEYNALEGIVANYANESAAVSFDAVGKLRYLKDAVWSIGLERDIHAASESAAGELSRLYNAYLSIAPEYVLDATNTDFIVVESVYDALKELLSLGNVPSQLLTREIESDAGFIDEFGKLVQKRTAILEKLKSYRTDDLLELDVDGLMRRIDENSKKFIVLRFFGIRAIVKELAGIKRPGGGELTFDELKAILPKVYDYQSIERAYKKDEQRARLILGDLWQGEATSWDGVAGAIERARKAVSIANTLGGQNYAVVEKCLEKFRGILPEAEKTLSTGTDLRKNTDDFLAAWKVSIGKTIEFLNYTELDVGALSIANVCWLLKDVLEVLTELRGVLKYRDARRNMAGYGVGDFADSVESGTIPVASINEEFELAYQTKMLNQILAVSPALSGFSGATQEDRITKFCELDKEYTRLSAKMVFAKVAANLPRRRSGSALVKGTPLGILRHECEKKARHKPVRQLLSEIGSLAGMLKPCFLMSPLSVAQYLPANADQFDLIVFDEASQIPVWDAVGVIARAKQVIIVGDPKQMPPTNFFQKGDGNAEIEADSVEDLESILDECLAAGVFSAYLNWHYRSRHESLISFSNHNYYEDKLLTFPSASESPRLGVSFEFVPGGVYDRKASRTNLKEATALVDYVFNRMKDPVQRERSMGVVTFSEAQKQLIEDLVEKRRESCPQYEECFFDERDEPFFVKNLENVQGDERDVILFSVCYAPDADGKFFMNFGPLNKIGGERRLNVAVTRAKEQVVLFASIHASQIDLNRTESVGVAHLKSFIDYAEKGIKAGAVVGAVPTKDDFSGLVSAFLEGKGYKVEHDVGLSDRKIDIAVRNPANEEEFLLGIECDGPSYASPRTVRDRDALRSSVLRMLGWNLCKVWSVDWALDRKRSEERLLAALEEAKISPTKDPKEVPLVEEPENEVDVPAPTLQYTQYTVWTPQTTYYSTLFYDHSSQAKIERQLSEVISQEGPICESVLFKRIAKAWDVRLTEKTIGTLKYCLPSYGISTTCVGDEKVYWAQGQKPNEYADFRVPTYVDDSKRAIDEIPPEEIANAMLSIVNDVGGVNNEQLYRETLRLFGLSALTTKAKRYLDVGWHVLERSGKLP